MKTNLTITDIFYTPTSGSLNTWPKNGNFTDEKHFLIAEDVPNPLASAFCAWVSRKRDLSNQFDKPWEYVGKKPKLKEIQDDMSSFFDAYRWINECKASKSDILNTYINQKLVRPHLTPDYIFNEVKTRFDQENPDLLSAFTCFIHCAPDTGMMLWDDMYMPFSTFQILLIDKKVKHDGVFIHQGMVCQRYRFTEFEYPKRFYKNHYKPTISDLKVK